LPIHRPCLPLIAAGVACGACLVIAGCSTPTRQTVSMAAAKAVFPADGTVLASTGQPVTLTAQNAVTTQPTLPVSDTFEVATESAFAHIVVTKTIPQGAGGQTSVTLDPLPPSTYYWRVRATAGGAVVTSTSGTFRIAAVLQAPVLVSPASGVLIGHLNQPIALVVQNPAPSPPVSGVIDSFDVATDAAFANVVVSKSVSPAAIGPTPLVLDPLPGSATYYWRVRVAATDAIGAVSGTASFRIGPALVSGPYRLTIAGSGTQLTFDSTLTVSTQALVFFNPGSDGLHQIPDDLVLRLTLDADRVSGSVVSRLAYPSSVAPNCCFPLGSIQVHISKSAEYGGNVATPVETSGSVNTDGRVTGAFDGYVAAEYINPLFRVTGHFNWTLAPR
jgi:hypothetical protein